MIHILQILLFKLTQIFLKYKNFLFKLWENLNFKNHLKPYWQISHISQPINISRVLEQNFIQFVSIFIELICINVAKTHVINL